MFTAFTYMGTIWRIRRSPDLAYSIPDEELITDPPRLPRYSITVPEHARRDDNYGEPRTPELPEWMPAAWTRMQNDAELTNLVGTFRESMLGSYIGLLMTNRPEIEFGYMANMLRTAAARALRSELKQERQRG
ncbi:MAG TPA: hypothetical protein VNP92_16570 [Actinophytocola sp.]|nr:hypothetical protein [Actinophytocola sp.]